MSAAGASSPPPPGNTQLSNNPHNYEQPDPPLGENGKRLDDQQDPDHPPGDGFDKVDNAATQKCSLCRNKPKKCTVKEQYVCKNPECAKKLCGDCVSLNHNKSYRGGRDMFVNGCWCKRQPPAWYNDPAPDPKTASEIEEERVAQSKRKENDEKRKAKRGPSTISCPAPRRDNDKTRAANAKLEAANKAANKAAEEQAAREERKKRKAGQKRRLSMDDGEPGPSSKRPGTLDDYDDVESSGTAHKPAVDNGKSSAAKGDRAGHQNNGKTERTKNTTSGGGKDSLGLENKLPPSNPEGDYTATSSHQTQGIATSRPPRLSRRGHIDYNDSSDSENDDETTHSPQLPPVRESTQEQSSSVDDIPVDFNDKTTIIVGGGVIGCLIAYQLARSVSQTNHRIIIIELLDQPLTLASGKNSGILDEGQAENVRDLAKYSMDEWERLAEDRHVCDDIDYGEQVFDVKCGKNANAKGVGHENAPEWLRGESHWSYVSAAEDYRVASTDPTAFRGWLLNRLNDLNVKFYVNSKLTCFNSSSERTVDTVIVQDQRSGRSMPIQCHNLVLTAGPWTDEVFGDLFDHSNEVRFNQRQSAAGWLLLDDPEQLVIDKTALRTRKHLTQDVIDFASRQLDNQLWVSFPGEDRTPVRPENLKRALVAESLADFVSAHLRITKDVDSIVQDQGRSFVSSRVSGMPIIARLPPSALGAEYDLAAESPSHGVYVAAGFGMYGLTNGMGAAKIICDLIHGKEPAISIEEFAPDELPPALLSAKAKGKRKIEFPRC